MMRTASVTTQLMLLAVLPLAILFIGLTLFHTHQRNLLLDEQFEARVHDLSRGLAARAMQSLLAGDMEALDELAREMVGESNIYGLRLADPLGDALVKRGQGPVSAPEGALRVVFMPLCLKPSDRDEPLRIGEVWIWFDQRPVNAIKRQGLWQAMGLATLLAVAVAFSAWRLATRILRPMREALRAIQRIAYGIGGVRIAEDADNHELRQLQRGVNLLAMALEQQDRLREEAMRHQLARERAEQTKEVRTRFLAHMSHEIRTPLSALVGFMHLLRRELAEQPLSLRSQQYLQAMGLAAQHLGELIGDILDFSRLESGKLELRAVSFSPAQILDDVAIEQAERARAKGLFIDVISYLDVPERVESDPLRLRQVLLNLLANAIKFTAEGGIILRAQLEEPPDEAGQGCVLRFAVEDSGPGIPEADRPRLLQAFEQLETGTERMHEGTGLGLAICRGIVEQAGGELVIGSSPHLGGALLEFTWPVPKARPATEPTRLPVCAVVADDRPSFCQMVYTRMARLGWTVELQGSLSALTEGEHPLPQCEVLALRDPVEQGEPGRLQLFTLVQQARGRVGYVLVCTARDEPEWERCLEQAGALVLRCPVSQHDLERAIGSLGMLPYHVSPRLASEHQPGALLEGLSILVVDDHPLNREVFAQMLRHAGARVIQAENGGEGLALAREADAVLLDLHMPGMDGEAVLRELKARHSALPVLLLTADTLADTEERLRLGGAAAVLHKPVSERRLLNAVAAALGRELRHGRGRRGIYPNCASASGARRGRRLRRGSRPRSRPGMGRRCMRPCTPWPAVRGWWGCRRWPRPRGG